MGIFINQVFPFIKKKKISVHMKTQMHALKNGQEHAKPTGGDIISTVKPCWPIRSLNKFLVGGNNSAGSDVTNQKLSCLHDNTATGVFENLHLGWSFKKNSVSVTWCSVCVWTNSQTTEKARVLKITAFVWTGPESYHTADFSSNTTLTHLPNCLIE